jgi:hypothetical protein
MNYKILFPFLVLFFSFIHSSNSQEKWELIKDSDGIKVYTKTKDNSPYVEIKAVSMLDGEILTFRDMMNDVTNYKEWMHAAEKTDLIRRESSSEFIYYMHSDFPWPAKDRDIVIKTVLHYKPEKGIVYTESESIKGMLEKKDGINRIGDLQASWHFEKEGEDRVKVTYYGRIKPSVQLPDWLAEIVYNTGPFNTIKNMREYIRNRES